MSAAVHERMRRLDFGVGRIWPLVLGLAVLAAPTMNALSDQVWSRDYGAHGPLIIATGLWLLWRRLPVLQANASPGHPALTILFLTMSMALHVFGRA